MTVSGLSLYQTEWCPFCVRVRGALARLGLEIEIRDISENRDHLRELFAATGGQRVPCLRIEDEAGDPRWLHESADIIAYLQERFGQDPAGSRQS